MNLKLSKLLVLFCIITTNLFSADIPFSGNFFTGKTELQNGFYFEQITLFPYGDKNRFLLSRLSYNKYRGYEENKIYGTIVRSEESGNLTLKANECSVYAVRKPGKKWILIKHYDCEHLEFQLTFESSFLRLSPGVSMAPSSRFYLPESASKTDTSCIVFKIRDKSAECWGTGMKFIRKNAKAIRIRGAEKQAVEIEEIVETTGRFQAGSVEIGDLIRIENAPVREIFD